MDWPMKGAVKQLSVREARRALSCLEEVVPCGGRITVTKRGVPIAIIERLGEKPRMPSHRDLRALMPRQKVPSEKLIREDRDSR
jgi:antitoxin (DNA-binding transcriptional repressor) of toxin-antitoxin stability system